jgi:hypothetical protein
MCQARRLYLQQKLERKKKKNHQEKVFLLVVVVEILVNNPGKKMNINDLNLSFHSSDGKKSGHKIQQSPPICFKEKPAGIFSVLAR